MLPNRLPVELLSNIASFLDWDDFANLSQVHTSFRDIVKDATVHGGPAAKWSLADFLLKREKDSARPIENPSPAIRLLEELAGLDAPSLHDGTLKQPYTSCKQYLKAIRALATCYLTGTGVSKSQQLGLQWLEVAYKNGDIEAAYEIAKIYENDHDVFKAVCWYENAAKAGHLEAMVEFAICLELGCGVTLSEEDALNWYTQAAELGHVTANYSVGEMFEDGRGGLPQSDSEACLWYFRAALKGDDDSVRALRRLGDVARIVLPGWTRALNVESAGNALL
jgi:TPR repeat protein